MPKDVVYLFDPNIGKYYYGKRFALKKFKFKKQLRVAILPVIRQKVIVIP
jgi:hypothetical protein